MMGVVLMRDSLFVLSGVAILNLSGCGSGVSSPPDVPTLPGQRCQVRTSEERPLIIEWDPSSRNDVEAQLKHEGVLVVRYDGCEMELLRECHAPGSYGYMAGTRQNESMHISTLDELYAKMPIGALGLEGELSHGRELRLDMSIVGKYGSRDAVRHVQRFNGIDCHRATHVVVGLTAGAFEMASEQQSEEGVGVSTAVVSVGGSHARQERTLRRAGDRGSCDRASVEDREPPDGCGALLRLELVPVECAGGTGKDCPTSEESGSAVMAGGPSGENAPGDAAFARILLDAAEAVQAAVQGASASGSFAVTFDAGPSDARRGFASLGKEARVLLVGGQLGLLRRPPAGADVIGIVANFTVHPNGQGRWGQVRIVRDPDEDQWVIEGEVPSELGSVHAHLQQALEGNCRLQPASQAADMSYLNPDVGELGDFGKEEGDARIASPVLLQAACAVAKGGGTWTAGPPMFEVAFGNPARFLLATMVMKPKAGGGYELKVNVPTASEVRK